MCRGFGSGVSWCLSGVSCFFVVVCRVWGEVRRGFGVVCRGFEWCFVVFEW